jgi:uncharacterized membrane protein (DUF106 family)
MKLFNSGVTGLFDLLFGPFARLSPLWALTVVSVLTGILMLWIFGLVSNQDAIRTIRDRIRGNLIAVRLFGDDLGLLFRLQGRLLKDNAIFLKYALIPLLVMIVPVLLILVQLNLRFGASPLEPGQSALVKVTLRDAATIEHGVSLEAPDGVAVETPAVRVAPLREVAWRIRPREAGRYSLLVRVGDERVEKELRVGEDWGAVSTRRTGESFFDSLLFPGEPPIRSEAVESVEIKYKPLELGLFGWPVNWLVFFFLLSILSGFAFRKVLGVEI